MNTQRYIATSLWILTSAAAQTPPGGLSCQAPSPIDLGGYSSFAGITTARPASLSRYFTQEHPTLGTQFQPPQTIGFRVPTGDANSRWVAADFDSNTLTDIGQIWNNNGRARISVRLAQLDGSVVSQTWLADAGPWVPSNVYLAGDYNNDGYNDIAVAWNEAGSVSITTFLSAGSSFYDAGKWSNRLAPWSANAKWLVGDFQGDRNVDILMAFDNFGFTQFMMWRSSGFDFSFPVLNPPTTLRPWQDSTAFVPMNLNGDLLTDVAAMESLPGSTYVAIPYVNIFGAFSANGINATLTISHNPGTSVKWAAGDFNGDGRSDLVGVSTKNQVTDFAIVTWRNGNPEVSRSEFSGVLPVSAAVCPGVFR